MKHKTNKILLNFDFFEFKITPYCETFPVDTIFEKKYFFFSLQ